MKKIVLILVGLCFSTIGLSENQLKKSLKADEALKILLDGNKRYVESKLEHPDQSINRIKLVAKEQHPLAAVLGCSDSRVPPEILFDQGLGDLFVVREIGNGVDEGTLGSLEYAAKHLGVSLILVLGHKRCGAVDAGIHKKYEGHIEIPVKSILPSIEQAKTLPGDLLDNSVRINIKNVVEKLRFSKPILSDLINKGQLQIVGGYYNLDTGSVELIKL